MSGLAQSARVSASSPAFARPMRRETFEAWYLREPSARGEAYRIDVSRARSLDEALSEASRHLIFKDTLVIVATDAVSGRKMAHFYAIKRQSQVSWRWNAEKLVNERYQKEYPLELFAMQVAQFSPVEPWAWSLGADVVGHDAGVIEGGAW